MRYLLFDKKDSFHKKMEKINGNQLQIDPTYYDKIRDITSVMSDVESIRDAQKRKKSSEIEDLFLDYYDDIMASPLTIHSQKQNIKLANEFKKTMTEENALVDRVLFDELMDIIRSRNNFVSK